MKYFALYLELDKYSQNVTFIIFFIIIVMSISCYMTNCLNATIHLLMNLQLGQGLVDSTLFHSLLAGRAEMGLETLLPR